MFRLRNLPLDFFTHCRKCKTYRITLVDVSLYFMKTYTRDLSQIRSLAFHSIFADIARKPEENTRRLGYARVLDPARSFARRYSPSLPLLHLAGLYGFDNPQVSPACLPRGSRVRSFALSPLLLIHTSSFVAFVNRDNARPESSSSV